MKSTHFHRDRERGERDRDPIPFPTERAGRERATSPSFMPDSVDDVLTAFDSMSRHITDLARELNCLGHFDDPNGDLPRAA